jgi:hypothetical protein
MLDPTLKGIRKTYGELLQQPLPERWIDLINRLNAEETAWREGTRPERNNKKAH